MSGPTRAVTPTAVLLGLLIAPSALGVSTTAVALPTISADLGLSHPEAAWVLAGYTLAQAILVALFGRLADISGNRLILLIGGALIAAGTVFTVASQGFVSLLAGRLLQGAGVAAAPVAGFGIAAALFDGTDRAKAVGMISAVLAVISGSGSLIGGLLTDGLSWRAVVAVPALTLPAIAATLHLASTQGTRSGRVDTVGAALVVVLASCVVLLLETPSIDFAAWVLIALAGLAAGAAALLARRIRRLPEGFIPAAVIRSRRYVLGALAALTLFGAYVAMLFAAPSLLLQDHDWTPTQIGLALMPAAVMGALTARAVGHAIATRDPFRLTATLALVSAAGLGIAGIADGSPVATTLGLGMALAGFMSAQVALVDRVPLMVEHEVRSIATGVFILIFLIGGAMGSAAVAGLTDPFGLAGAVAAVAALPAAGAVLCLAAGAS
ncbi:MAG TPA: MFS transporter [Thermoleophilaceae bacterium]|nr:MFS transporter [Thermoleophilaceae bacterium]